jgi:hypothetical protein
MTFIQQEELSPMTSGGDKMDHQCTQVLNSLTDVLSLRTAPIDKSPAILSADPVGKGDVGRQWEQTDLRHKDLLGFVGAEQCSGRAAGMWSPPAIVAYS